VAKQEDRVLSAVASVPADTRPQFLTVQTPDGPARIRRMQPEVLFVVLSEHLPGAHIDPANITIERWHQHETVARLLQLCLARMEDSRLAYHGGRGLAHIAAWSRATLTELARKAAEFMEF